MLLSPDSGDPRSKKITLFNFIFYNSICKGFQSFTLSRVVTKIRFVVEQVFGKLKKRFKYFANPANNSLLDHDFEILQIAFSLMNMFHKPTITDQNYLNIAREMKLTSN